MVSPSRGLLDHKRVRKHAEKGTGKAGSGSRMPIYLDGTLYRIGDEVLEGSVSYYRPAYENEDSSVDALRLVVLPRDGGRAIAVPPSKTRAVRNERDQT